MSKAIEISYSPYTLKALSALSAQSTQQEREGALIRVESAEGFGYADVHPWTELGDLSVDKELELLKLKPTALGQRSLALAGMDLDARSQKKSAFENLKIPFNHYLVHDVQSLSEIMLQKIWQQGFRCLKFKIGRDPKAEAQKLNDCAKELSAYRLRLDCNSKMTPAIFAEFAEDLSLAIRLSVEFIEDPMPLNLEQWKAASFASDLNLALDRASAADLSGLREVATLPFQWLVIKPAVQNPLELAQWAYDRKLLFCVTSYLDHPVGQMGAALEAAKIWKEFPIGECGLTSHFGFEKNEFSEALSCEGPLLKAPQGTGIGFDDLLARRDWKKL